MNVPEELITFLRSCDDVFIATHIDPEGDALGSSIALSLALGQLGKRSCVFNRDAVPALYAFLPHHRIVTDTAPDSIDTLLLLDCNSRERAGLENANVRFAAVIDHHLTNNGYGDLRWIVPTAPATGLMVFNLVKALGVTITKDMAVNLYTAIGIDTGIFRYVNTSAECLSAASELVVCGADPAFIADRLFNTFSKGRFMLLRCLLETLELHQTVAVASITSEMFADTGTTSADTENLVNFSLQMDEVRVSALIRQVGESSWKVSLRSKGEIDVARVAAQFGGGGHRNAAGCTISGELSSVKRMLLTELQRVSA